MNLKKNKEAILKAKSFEDIKGWFLSSFPESAAQRRAKAGGEYGENGEFYEGGKFIANTDKPKGQSKWKKPTGKVEVDKGEWVKRPDTGPDSFAQPLYGMLAGVEKRNADGSFQLNEGITTESYGTAEERQTRIDLWNEGKRWVVLDGETRKATGEHLIKSGEFAAPPFLDTKEVERAYFHTSMNPGNAAIVEKQWYESAIERFREELKEHLPEGKEVELEQEVKAFAEEYLKRRKSALSVRSNSVSSAVSGRSKFNSKQAKMRSSALDKSEEAFSKWKNKARWDAEKRLGNDVVRQEKKFEDMRLEREAKAKVDKMEREQRKAQTKLPLINDPDSTKHMTSKEWKETPSDYRAVLVSDEGYRYRSVMVFGGTETVFLTDKKVVKKSETFTESEVMSMTAEDLEKPEIIEAAEKAWQEQGTESPFFKRWFAGSKVVGDDGKPLVVYHGTDKDFDEFKMGKKAAFDARGFYFSPHRSVANNFTAGKKNNVKEVYLTIKNPYQAKSYLDIGFMGVEKMKDLKSLGYDGAHFVPKKESDWFQEEWVAFDSSQIKAVQNRGTFNEGSDKILESV